MENDHKVIREKKNKKNKKEKINILLANSKNKELLEDLLDKDFEIISKQETDFNNYDLIIMDVEHIEKYRFQINRFKQNKNSFTPIICLRDESKNTLQNLFKLAEDVVDLPISKILLLTRIENLVSNKRLIEKCKVLEEKYKNIFDNINDMVFLMDTFKEKGQMNFLLKVSETNQKLREKLNYTDEILKNSSPVKFMSDKDIRGLYKNLTSREEVLFTTEFFSSQGEAVPVEINARMVQIEEKKQMLCAARDITEKKEKEKEVNYLLFHDVLTGLYNRRFFEEEMKRLDTARQLPLCIFIIDVNGMKLINDSFGHKAGDELLIKTVNLLEEIFRKEDILARWGGDEFSVLLPQTKGTEAEKILARMKAKCEETETGNIPISLGIGYAVKEDEEQDIFDILHKADAAMYKDKLFAQTSASNKIIKNLLSTLEAKSPETEAHTKRLTNLALKLGKKIGLSANQLNNLSLLATLHDIGKVNISEEILRKPGDLTNDEWEQIREHPRIGYKIASSCEDFSAVAAEILAHHEHWNGEGYPKGLKEDQIPLLSRIISIVDAYDVMINGRPYQDAVSKKEALIELNRCGGSQFDPQLVREFIELMS